jgi:D-glycero-alpha-D-manno-heptose-7-phosphate kinase
MIISRTPFRVSFLGGGTDYADWYREHGGRVLAAAIDKYTYVTCRPRSPLSAHRWRVVYSRDEVVDQVGELVHPPTRACLEYLGIQQGLEIHSDADLPARTGLGSSSSFTVGLLHALHHLEGREPAPMALALEAVHVERRLLGEPGGAQDQVIAAIGGLNRIEFDGPDRIQVRAIDLSPHRAAQFWASLLMVFTGFTRSAPEIAAGQIRLIPDRRAELEAMKALVDEGWSLLRGQADLSEFGRLLHESWLLKKRLNPEASNGRIDEWYEQAKAVGALGGKLLGAGGGGFLLFFAPPERHAAIVAGLGLMPVSLRLADSGSRIVFSSLRGRP